MKRTRIVASILLSLYLRKSSSIEVFDESAGARKINDAQDHGHEVHCSRERSRAAWKAIDKYLMPFVEREGFHISSKCKLHPDNDLFRDQEQHKIHVDDNEWRCGYCKKSFSAEKYLDRHFDTRHYDLLNISLADSCFPVNQGPAASRLHELFLRQFCDAHTCIGGRKPFSRGGRKQTSVFYLATSILIMTLLLVFYLIVYLHQREFRKGTQELKRISQLGRKAKPS